jgi:hypothetical protein
VRTYAYFVRTLVWAVAGTAFVAAVGAQPAWLQLTLCDAGAARALYAPANPAPVNFREMLAQVKRLVAFARSAAAAT